MKPGVYERKPRVIVTKVSRVVLRSAYSATGTEETDGSGAKNRGIGSTTKPCISVPEPADSRTQQLPKATEALQLAQSAQFYGEHHIARNTRFRPVRNYGEKVLLRTVAGCETGPPSLRTIAGAPKLETDKELFQKCTEETSTDSATANEQGALKENRS